VAKGATFSPLELVQWYSHFLDQSYAPNSTCPEITDRYRSQFSQLYEAQTEK